MRGNIHSATPITMSPSQPTKPTCACSIRSPLGIGMSQMAFASMNAAPEAKVMMKQRRLVFIKRRMTGGMGGSPFEGEAAPGGERAPQHTRKHSGK
jgi:hypothetical protein